MTLTTPQSPAVFVYDEPSELRHVIKPVDYEHFAGLSRYLRHLGVRPAMLSQQADSPASYLDVILFAHGPEQIIGRLEDNLSHQGLLGLSFGLGTTKDIDFSARAAQGAQREYADVTHWLLYPTKTVDGRQQIITDVSRFQLYTTVTELQK
jgi:hypothetical protein